MPERLSKKIRSLIMGDPWGEVYPHRDNPPPPPEDGRTVALRILKLYLSELSFYRRMGADVPPKKFQVPSQDIHIEWPENEVGMVFPSIVLQAIGPGESTAIGLNGYVEEKTRDVYAPGTVVQWQNEYVEVFAIDLYASAKSERRALVAGIVPALTPTEQMAGLRFRMPDYYNQAVCFSINDREIIEDEDAARNRRRARVRVEMRYNEIALVNVVGLTTRLDVQVDACDETGELIELDEEQPLPRDPALPALPRGPDVGSTC